MEETSKSLTRNLFPLHLCAKSLEICLLHNCRSSSRLCRARNIRHLFNFLFFLS